MFSEVSVIGGIMIGIRNSAKAIIINDGCVLLTKNIDDEGAFYLLPGGGQNKYETLQVALKRECMEETGYEINVGPLISVREYIGKHHEHVAHDKEVHQVELMFLCETIGHPVVKNGTNPDEGQVSVQWVPLSELNSYRLYPSQIKRYLASHTQLEHIPSYFGDVN